MGNKEVKMVFFEEYLELKNGNLDVRKYAPFFKAISKVDNIIYQDTYYNNEDGIFVKANININLPSLGTYKHLDIHENEELFFYLPSQYPFMAPSVFLTEWIFRMRNYRI